MSVVELKKNKDAELEGVLAYDVYYMREDDPIGGVARVKTMIGKREYLKWVAVSCVAGKLPGTHDGNIIAAQVLRKHEEKRRADAATNMAIVQQSAEYMQGKEAEEAFDRAFPELKRRPRIEDADHEERRRRAEDDGYIERVARESPYLEQEVREAFERLGPRTIR
jgi:hypothetical protein